MCRHISIVGVLAVLFLSSPLLADALPNTADTAKTGGAEIWKDASKPIDARVNDLVSRLSLAEKVQQVRNDAPAIPRSNRETMKF